MSSPAFTLQTSPGSAFRKLLPEVAGRYVEIMGGSTSECEALARTLAEQVETLAAGGDTMIEIACTPLAHGIDVTIRANGRTAVVHHPLTAAKS
jgi:hypothetical protein